MKECTTYCFECMHIRVKDNAIADYWCDAKDVEMLKSDIFDFDRIENCDYYDADDELK